jgi:hypothetical protein
MTPSLCVVLDASLKDSQFRATTTPQQKTTRIAILKGDIYLITPDVIIECRPWYKPNLARVPARKGFNVCESVHAPACARSFGKCTDFFAALRSSSRCTAVTAVAIIPLNGTSGTPIMRVPPV